MIKVRELNDYDGYRAFQGFHGLMLGLKMLPAYMSESYEDFFGRIYQMPPEDQAKMIQEASWFVEVPIEHVRAMVSFCSDKNGVPYGPSNMRNLTPPDFIEIITAVGLEICKFKIDLLSGAEKKN